MATKQVKVCRDSPSLTLFDICSCIHLWNDLDGLNVCRNYYSPDKVDGFYK